MVFSNSPTELEPSEVEAISKAVKEFNLQLSKAYFERKPEHLNSELVSDSLRQSYSADIRFLESRGRALKIAVESLEITSERLLSEGFAEIHTRELVKIKYMSTRDQSVVKDVPDEIYTMKYSMTKIGSSWLVDDASPVSTEPVEM
jgi:predicted glycoside hydrolase/deacetylase ChbG (UPF0249 family)